MESNTKRVLITGAPERVEALGKRFAVADVEQVTLAQLGPGARAVDYYVQLGVVVPARGDTLVRRGPPFLGDRPLHRVAVRREGCPPSPDACLVVPFAGGP